MWWPPLLLMRQQNAKKPNKRDILGSLSTNLYDPAKHSRSADGDDSYLGSYQMGNYMLFSNRLGGVSTQSEIQALTGSVNYISVLPDLFLGEVRSTFWFEKKTHFPLF